jgi:hypothetical protein
MASVCVNGKPDFFVTKTCNPKWPEIKYSLIENQDPQDRPDIIARVFFQRFKKFIERFTKDHIFGELAAWIWVIEFQKRGLPHAHCLFTLKQEYKIRNIETLDKLIWAQIPDKVILKTSFRLGS